MAALTPCLWFDGNAEEAARYYVSLLPNSRIDDVQRSPLDWPSGKTGEVIVVLFTLAGTSYMALNGGPEFKFTPAISLSVSCDGQAEVDRLWDKLLADGGSTMACGWLSDRYGLSWQIVPAFFERIMREGNEAGKKRAMGAMMDMIKLDEAALLQAYEGGEAGR